ncbi:hypothetical protein CYA_0446 [Synechococcus sp. JA-3-3Ab]|nr:hypothetical protein CYA_0446 [Synechococcus sp. JA-3-3Ab]
MSFTWEGSVPLFGKLWYIRGRPELSLSEKQARGFLEQSKGLYCNGLSL